MEELMQNPTPTAGTPKKQKKTPSKRKWLIPILVLLLIIAGAVIFLRSRQSRATTATAIYQETTAEVRDITTSLTGSGTLQPADSYTVTTLVSGEILSDTFEEGDAVGEDDLLYVIDSSDASTTLTQAQKSYDQALENYEDAVANQYPTSEMTGVVSEVYVRNGDIVSAGQQLCKIMGDNSVTVDFQFSYAEEGDFYPGQSAAIFLNGYEDRLTGTVQQVSKAGLANATGMVMTTVRVSFDNPGLVSENSTASAVIGNYTSYGWTAVRVGTASVVTAAVGGKVTEMDLLPGDPITYGDRVCALTGDTVEDKIDSAKTALENAEISLDNAKDKLENYEITSPISGTVIEKYAKAGDNASTGNSGSSTLCIIYDLSYLEMTLSIDELDIKTVEVGQKVSITADAAEGMVYSGVVTKVSIVGSTSGGITVYPVTVRIDEYDGLLPGMNVDAEIVLSSAEGVLAIPGNALNRGDTVLITADSPSAVNALEQEAPEGYVYVQVTTGASDDSYIEITSGLQAGDTVAYLRSASGNEMMMGMMGGMPGGMPGGMGAAAMPSGGMPGGNMGDRPSGGMPSGGGGFRG